jgi:hypothetical protein
MSQSFMKNKKRGLNKIPFNRVESFRKTFDYKICEIAELLGFTARQYSRCRSRGWVSAYRYHALKDAMLIHILQENQSRLELLSRM